MQLHAKHLFLFSFCLVSCSLFSMQEDAKETIDSSFVRNVLVGSAAGGAEVLFNQPTVLVKNQLQQRAAHVTNAEVVKRLVRNVKESPSQLYRGLGVNTVCMVPTTAAQVSVNEALKGMIPGEDVPTSLGRNAIAGAFSALTCNPSELIIVNQQNWKASAWATAQRLHRENGISIGMRGYSAKAARDALFCAGFLTAYPQVKDQLPEQIESPLLRTILATALVGPVTGAASHPFDTLSTRMQADASKQNIQGVLSAARAIYAEGGFKAFFSGFTPRTARIMTAIPLMSAVKDWLNSER